MVLRRVRALQRHSNDRARLPSLRNIHPSEDHREIASLEIAFEFAAIPGNAGTWAGRNRSAPCKRLADPMSLDTLDDFLGKTVICDYNFSMMEGAGYKGFFRREPWGVGALPGLRAGKTKRPVIPQRSEREESTSRHRDRGAVAPPALTQTWPRSGAES
jgi:hypothetical protein